MTITEESILVVGGRGLIGSACVSKLNSWSSLCGLINFVGFFPAPDSNFLLYSPTGYGLEVSWSL